MYVSLCLQDRGLLTNKRLFWDSEIKYQSIKGHHLILSLSCLPNTVNWLQCCLMHFYLNFMAGTIPVTFSFMW